MQHKSECFANFVKFKLLVENQFTSNIKQLQSDGGGEYNSTQFQSFLTKHGIIHRKSCPHTSQQNGLAERKLRHILETGLTLLAHSHLSNRYWPDAFLTAVYIINRLPTPILQNTSPFFKLYNREPDYKRLRVFGCLCYPFLRPYGLHKLEYRSKPCIFLGYIHAGYKCLDPVTNKVYLSKHVIFDEESFPAQDQATSLLPSKINAQGDVPLFISLPIPLPSSLSTAPNLYASPSTPETSAPSSPETTSSPTSTISSPTVPNSTHPEIPALSPPSVVTHPPAPPIPPPTHSMTTRSRTGSLKPKDFSDFQLYHTSIPELEPVSYRKAAADPRWRAAMQLEYDALMSNVTWTLCPRPSHHNVIRNKWVFKIKKKADGSVERFKARLVAKGFDQQSGVDYTETFSPVIKASTIRVILALVVHFDWQIRQLDVSNAFLQGSLCEEVYMEQPPGFIDNVQPDFVCKLHKAIYGLKQAPRAWFTRLSNFLLDIGFQASLVDTSLFIYLQGSIQIYMLVYVDDILLTGTHPSVISAIIMKLQSEFPLKDLGPLHYFLGIQVTRTATGIHVCQTKYITELFHKANMHESKHSKSSCTSGSKLSKYDGIALPDPTTYRQVVGALQYCTLTRPEIAYSVNQLCQHMHAPSSTHWIAAKRVLRYLNGSPDHGLYYTKSNLQLNAFCDSDWAGCPDDRRSTSGFAVFLGDCLIAWSAKKQAVVSRSSTEAEYRSLSIATAELYWLRMLFKELKIFLSTPPVLWCDNVSALALASNPVFHARTKHIEVDYHFVREKVLNRDIIIKFISTQDQVADIFTKGLSSARFLALKVKLMVVPPPINLRGGVKGYQASMRSSAIQVRSIAESSEGLIAPSVAPSMCLEERRRDVRSCADSFAPSVAPSECLEERRRDVRTIADSFAPSVAPSECLEERRRDVRTIAHHKRSIALECKHCSRSCRKSNTQYGKILEISQSPLPARNVTLKVCRRKE
jgi:hypothetical protein